MSGLWTQQGEGDESSAVKPCERCGGRTDGRYCQVCGLDSDPGRDPADINQHRLAQDREQQWLRAHPGQATTKTCPDCAESVAAAALVCRFCGYRFDTGQPGRTSAAIPSLAPAAAPAPAARKSPGGAGVLGFVIAGLGHLYVGEHGRAALIFASAIAAAVGAYLGPPALGLAALIVLVFSVRDAYSGAQHFNQTGVTRPLAGGLWAIAGLAAAALTVGIAIDSSSGGGALGGGGKVDTGALEDQIKPELQRQLRVNTTDDSVSVDNITCIGGSGLSGTCLADVSDSTGASDHVSISYSVDPDTGDAIWHTDQ